MSYYSVSGNKYKIRRNISVNYGSKKWDDQNFSFITDAVISQEKLSKELNVTAPYADTYFTVTGDQFMDFWSETTSVSTDDLYQAIAVIGKATATQNVRDAANELDSQSGELSGSAPIDIEFNGYANYPVVTYQAWEISKDREFNLIEATYNEQDLVYSFIEEGTTYVRYVISNADSSCESIVETII